MVTLISKTGSTVADAVSQGNAVIAAGNFVDQLTIDASTGTGDLGGTGLQVTVSFIKDNGPFAGFSGNDRITLAGAVGSLQQVLDTLAPAAGNVIVGYDVAQLGSPTTGSATYYGVVAKNSFIAA